MSTRTRATASVAAGLVSVLILAPAAAASDATAEYDGRSTEDAVRLVVGSLVGIAAVTAALLVAYVWHTSPRRRARVAARRVDPDVDDVPVP